MTPEGKSMLIWRLWTGCFHHSYPFLIGKSWKSMPLHLSPRPPGCSEARGRVTALEEPASRSAWSSDQKIGISPKIWVESITDHLSIHPSTVHPSIFLLVGVGATAGDVGPPAGPPLKLVAEGLRVLRLQWAVGLLGVPIFDGKLTTIKSRSAQIYWIVTD